MAQLQAHCENGINHSLDAQLPRIWGNKNKERRIYLTARKIPARSAQGSQLADSPGQLLAQHKPEVGYQPAPWTGSAQTASAWQSRGKQTHSMGPP